jgi:hypothetical protein
MAASGRAPMPARSTGKRCRSHSLMRKRRPIKDPAGLWCGGHLDPERHSTHSRTARLRCLDASRQRGGRTPPASIVPRRPAARPSRAAAPPYAAAADALCMARRQPLTVAKLARSARLAPAAPRASLATATLVSAEAAPKRSGTGSRSAPLADRSDGDEPTAVWSRPPSTS